MNGKLDTLIIVNPNSGTSNRIEILNNFIKKYFKNRSYKLLITKSEKELNNIIDELCNFKHIIVVGGDGTISSLIQKTFNKRLLIGHIPTGSGNGLTHSLLHSKGLKFDNDYEVIYKNIADAIIKNRESKIDTMIVKKLESNTTINSFLFVSCGIFSNLDLNTDWMRKLGEIRFILGAIYELIKYFFFGNSIKGRLEYLDEKYIKITEIGEFAFFLASNMSHTSRTSMTSPYSKPDDGYIYLSYLKEPTNTWTVLQVLLGLDDGSYINKLKYRRTKWFKFIPSNGVLDIDGERHNIEPIEVSINPKSLRFLY